MLLDRQDADQSQCRTSDLVGAFQLDMSGTVVDAPPLSPGSFARDGRLVFDGRGGFAGQAAAMYQDPLGGVRFESISGGYSVDSDCNVALTFGAHTWVGTLTHHSRGADLIVADNGVVISGTLKKQKSGEGDE